MHVEKGDSEGKIWLEPVLKIGYLIGFTNNEQKDILSIVNKNQEQFEKDGMNTSTNSFDSIEQIIYENKLRITSIDFHKELNMMLVILNSGIVLQKWIYNYPLLKTATENQLKNFRFIGGGTGVHWPDLDEDLSLKTFLVDEFKRQVIGNPTNSTYAMGA